MAKSDRPKKTTPSKQVLSVIMPVYNEAKTFKQILNRVIKQPVLGMRKEIIIVDDMSTDGTRDQIIALTKGKPRKRKAKLSDNQEYFYYEGKSSGTTRIKICLKLLPRGKGRAVKVGLGEATGDIVLIQDADLEYDTKDYPNVVKPIIDGKANFVLGSRHLGKKHWKIRKFKGVDKFYAEFINFGSIIMDGTFNILYGVKLTDPQTMYKVFRRECIDGIKFRENGFHMDYEICIKLIKAGHKPIEVPVRYESRSYSEGKKVKIISTGLQDVKTILKYRFVN